MIGFAPVTDSSDKAPAPRTLSVRFDAAAPQDPVVEALPSDRALAFNQGLERSIPFRLRLGTETTDIPVSLSRNSFAADDSKSIISCLLRGERVTGVDHSGGVRMTFPGEDFARAFVAMRMMQTLAMSVGRTEPPVSIRRTSPPLPDDDASADVRSFSNCSAASDGVRLTRHYLSQAGELWRFDCADPPVSDLSFWFVRVPGGTRSRPLVLSDRDGGSIDAGTFGIPNASFDFDLGVLRSFVHPHADVTCGIAWVWANTRDGFRLIEVREMPVCGHLQVSDWIVTYRRETAHDATDE